MHKLPPFNADKFTTKTRTDSIKSANIQKTVHKYTNTQTTSLSDWKWHVREMPESWVESCVLCTLVLILRRKNTSNYNNTKPKTMNSIRIRFINFPCSSFKAMINQNREWFFRDRGVCIYVCGKQAVCIECFVWLVRLFICESKPKWSFFCNLICTPINPI